MDNYEITLEGLYEFIKENMDKLKIIFLYIIILIMKKKMMQSQFTLIKLHKFKLIQMFFIQIYWTLLDVGYAYDYEMFKWLKLIKI